MGYSIRRRTMDEILVPLFPSLNRGSGSGKSGFGYMKDYMTYTEGFNVTKPLGGGSVPPFQ